MSFFEPLLAAQNRSGQRWSRGVADFDSLGPAGKTVAAGVGVGGAAAGVAYGVVKTLGVAGYEFYDASFHPHRVTNQPAMALAAKTQAAHVAIMPGRVFFDYVTRAPVVMMLVSGSVAAGIGAVLAHSSTVVAGISAALAHIGVHVPWNTIPTTFLAGTFVYLGGQFWSYLSTVVSATSFGFAGTSMSWLKHHFYPEAGEPPATPALVNHLDPLGS